MDGCAVRKRPRYNSEVAVDGHIPALFEEPPANNPPPVLLTPTRISPTEAAPTGTPTKDNESQPAESVILSRILDNRTEALSNKVKFVSLRHLAQTVLTPSPLLNEWRRKPARRPLSRIAYACSCGESAEETAEKMEGALSDDSDEPTPLSEHLKIMKIGQGAYGTVWLAEDLRKNRLVALKKLRLNDEREGFPKNAMREISLLTALRHPNIVKFHGVLHSRSRKESLRQATGVGGAANLNSGTPSTEESGGFGNSSSDVPPTTRSSRVFSSVDAVKVLSGPSFNSNSGRSQAGGGGRPLSSNVSLVARDETREPVGNSRKRPATATTQTAAAPRLPCELSDAPTRGSVWMSFEYLPFDLSGVVEQTRWKGVEGMSQLDVRIILRDILTALAFCHSRGVLHRDLKTANLLVARTGRVQLADFGLARAVCPSRAAVLTNRVITLWYRPPELLLGADWYTASTDIWSAGCILGELALGRALFAAENESKVLKHILEVLGPPSASDLAEFKRLPFWTKKDFNPFLNTDSGSTSPPVAALGSPLSPKPKRTTLFTGPLLSRIGELGVDLLKRMLAYNPGGRISARDALLHPWLASLPKSSALSTSKFNNLCGHVFNLRKDRVKQQNATGPGAQRPTYSAGAAQRRLGPRMLNSGEFLTRLRHGSSKAVSRD